MAERAIWMRFLKRYWLPLLFSAFLVLTVLHLIVPSIFPPWLANIATIFRD